MSTEKSSPSAKPSPEDGPTGPSAPVETVPEESPRGNAVPPTSAKEKRRKLASRSVVSLLVVASLLFGGSWYVKSLATVSTDDAYVNGHVTYVAPRVAGQVAKVFVDDNNRVQKGDLIIQLDKEPFLVQRQIAESSVESAKADLIAAQAAATGSAAEVRTKRFALERAIEEVDNQIALLKSRTATLNSQRASEQRAKSDYERNLRLAKSGATTQQQTDLMKEAFLVATARVEEALQQVYQVRVGLGLSEKPAEGIDLAEVPADLDQTFSSVREAQAALINAAAKLGVSDSFNKSPRQLITDFYQRHPHQDVDGIYADLIENAPGVRQAEARLLETQRNLAQAELNLRYTDVVAEIDGVVTRRNVNPGNNVVVGQSLMAVRSLTEIWIDANFKETQLANLRIGQPVELDIDMYGSRRRFQGRISGFTMGTGSTLALLPAQNATGNFVKVVQRLPVRIDVLDYDPEENPLFVGLSVEPRVRIKELPTGPNAGKFLQPSDGPARLASTSVQETTP